MHLTLIFYKMDILNISRIESIRELASYPTHSIIIWFVPPSDRDVSGCIVLLTLSSIVEGKAETSQSSVPTPTTDPENADQNAEGERVNVSGPGGGAPVLLRVGLDEVQNTK